MLAFLHTAAVHVATFTRLTSEIDASVPTRHELREDLFAQALAEGQVSEALRRAVQHQVQRLGAEGARVVVCTCSTLGEAAEQTPGVPGVSVMRLDRPMADRAASLGRSVLVVATTATGMATALALLREAARTRQAAPMIRELLCSAAWDCFQAGDQAGYAAAIAERVDAEARPDEVVMLAQASMAPAALLVRRAELAVLTSPDIGVRAAIAAHGAAALP